MGAGVDVTRYQGVYGTGSIDGGISYNSNSTTISVAYHRGFSAMVGVPGVVQGHSVTASLSQLYGRRINTLLAADYTRGSSLTSSIEYVSGSAELRIALQNHLMLSTNYWLVSQKVPSNVALGFPGVNRYKVSAGVHYYLPSLLKRQTR